MAEVSNRQLNISLAGQIALNLDKQDEKGQDGKITKSVWDDFWNKNDAEFKGKNENISEDGISVREAMGLIMTRLFNAAKATGKSVDDVAKNLFEKSGGEKIDANTVKFSGEETAPSKETSPSDDVKKTKANSTVKKTQSSAYTPPMHTTPPNFSEIKRYGKNYSHYNLINDYREQAQKIYSSRSQAKKNLVGISKYLSGKNKYINENRSEYNVNKDNVAYTINELFNSSLLKNDKKSQEVMWGLMSDLINKANELHIRYDKKKLQGSTFNIKDSATIAEVKRLVKEIISRDDNIINYSDAFETMQTPSIKYAGKTITKNGKTYEYDENGQIKSIMNENGGGKFFGKNSDGTWYLFKNKVQLSLYADGSVSEYMEDTSIDGGANYCWVYRRADGVLRNIHDVGGDPFDEARSDKSGKIISYTVAKNIDKNNYVIEYRNPNGDLLGYMEEHMEGVNHTFLIKDKNGNVICSSKCNGKDNYTYYDSNGRKITLDKYMELRNNNASWFYDY